MRTEGIGGHLVFAWTPAGYSLEARSGEAPRPGTAVDEGDRCHRVTRVSVSPLPGDTRPCAYLLPVNGNGDVVACGPAHPAATYTPERPPVDFALVEADEADDLLTLLGRYPEGTCVVTVDAGGRRLGLSVGSLVLLSLDPPLVGFTVPNDEAIHDVVPLAGGCAISILAGGQAWLAQHFETSERPIAMWHGLAGEPGAAGAPLFVGALGWLECTLVDTADLGTETLFVCDVRDVQLSTEAPGLARVRGHYDAV